MAKRRGRLLAGILASTLVVAGVAGLSACSDNKPNDTPTQSTDKQEEVKKEYKVTFMIKENGTGEWKEYVPVVTSDKNGKVTLPEEPSVKGFSFRGWYTDEACTSGKEFDNENVTSDTVVYAFLSDKILTVNINTDAKDDLVLEEQTVSGLTEIEAAQKEAAAAKNLTFDGWYSNAACTTPYDAESGATEVYGRYVAKINFVDGYSEIEYSQVVLPGEKMAAVDETKIKASYMDSIYGYTIVDANGKPIEKDNNGAGVKFDFESAVDENITLSVMWASKGLKYKKDTNGNLVMTAIAQDKNYESVLANGVKVVRIPEYAKLDGEGDYLPVKTISLAENMTTAMTDVEKIIIAEGIQTVSGFNAMPSMMEAMYKKENKVNEIVMPESLKIIDTAFWNLGKMKEFNIPEGVEVIIDSFWNNTMGGSLNDEAGFGESTYGFDINVPAGIKNLSIVPANLKFADGDETYFYEDGALYKKGATNKYETLISIVAASENYVVKEGVEFVQVGALYKCYTAQEPINITLPSTFKNVSYNLDGSLYPFYVGGIVDSGMASGDEKSYYRLNKEGLTTAKGKAMLVHLEALGRVEFRTPGRPEGLANDAIMAEVDWNKFEGFAPNAEFEKQDKVVFNGKIAKDQAVKVVVRAYYKGELVKTVELKNILSENTLITQDLLAEALGLKGNNDYMITKVTQFAEDYFANNEAVEGIMVDCNQYLNVTYADNAAGAKLEEVNGVMTVTGFDKASAKFDAVSGGYVVAIPEVFNGKPVEAIAADAFKQNEEVVEINIPAAVKTIGDNAFLNTPKLTKVLFAEASKLEVVGAHAFEDCAIKEIALPLKNLKDVKPYAFRTATLEKFVPVKGEEIHNLSISFEKADYSNLYGKYVLFGNGVGELSVLYKLNNVTFGTNPQDAEFMPGCDTPTFDMDLVAICGGTHNEQLAVGTNVYDIVIVEVNVLEGSIYYLDNMCKASRGSFGVILTKHIKKMHENAFTRISNDLLVVHDKDGNPTKQSNLNVAAGYGLSHNEAPALTMETMKAFFKSKAFQNEDGTLVKWYEGKVFDDAEIEKLDPAEISYHYSNIS